MKSVSVQDLMIPLHEYATVHEEDLLHQAVHALEQAQKNFLAASKERRYPHRAVLVVSQDEEVVGKLSQLDILRSLEPKYDQLVDSRAMNRTTTSGFSLSFLRSMVSDYGLFDRPLVDLCRKAASIKVKDCMLTPDTGEFVHVDDTLEFGVHQLIVGQHQSLLVLEKKRIVGILRLVDVFHQIAELLQSCAITPPQGE
ncbi:CBS domain-containing protein [Desulfovermiculus halophilus]|uniref:CBS domain-containing protein n=1 Tax=Desulfovermiculus halophilus TaxID=339722 RepID=UPI000487F60F|nr:CBS domain-containing protein [Desulfovermiculus halophilus]